MTKVLVRTESGSEYTLDHASMTFERTNNAPHTAAYVAGSGKLVYWPEVYLYERMKLAIVDNRLEEGFYVTETSPVVDFETLED